MSNMKKLLNTLPQVGKVEWIGLRRVKRETLDVVNEVEASTESGLIGDRYSGKSGKRQVTLIQKEHLSAVGSMLNQESIDPNLLRRNVVVSGLNLLALKDKQFQIGEAVLEMTGLCHPCSRMEENLGEGGYNAMRGHGGITARVIKSGLIKTNDTISFKG
jgi:MOSC domain-containing protein YiiM